MHPAKSTPPVLQQLRDATQTAHQALERGLPLMRHDLSRSTYTALLERFYALYVPLEARLMAHTPALMPLGIDVISRRKTQWLAKDLADLGSKTSPARRIQPAPVPRVDNVWQALGCLYVTEGATLGGQIIARHLRSRLQLSPTHGTSFFTSYAGQTGAMWRQYRSALICSVAGRDTQMTTHAVSQIVSAATHLFDVFKATLAPEETP